MPDSEARILTARPGLADPAGILLSEAMTDLMQTLRQKFQVVIVDTAPLDLVSDAAPMVRLSDRVVLMVLYGIPRQDVESALHELDELGATQVLTVLSMVPRSSRKKYDSNYSA